MRLERIQPKQDDHGAFGREKLHQDLWWKPINPEVYLRNRRRSDRVHPRIRQFTRNLIFSGGVRCVKYFVSIVNIIDYQFWQISWNLLFLRKLSYPGVSFLLESRMKGSRATLKALSNISGITLLRSDEPVSKQGLVLNSINQGFRSSSSIQSSPYISNPS